jgi:hypothetical protein
MVKEWPTTQHFLLDHLRRIVEGVSCSRNEVGKEEWWFGLGDDTVGHIPNCDDESDGKLQRKIAEITLFLEFLGVTSRDYLGVRASSEHLQKELQYLFGDEFKIESDSLDDNIKELPDVGTLQTAYAYEMLKKLGSMVERSKQVFKERKKLKGLPKNVDRYMKEAATCFRYGFDLACICMCRAVLEETLKDLLKRKCGEAAIKSGNERSDRLREACLQLLIERAVKNHILSSKNVTLANEIKKCGDGIVHGNLNVDARKKALECFRNARQIVAELYK